MKNSKIPMEERVTLNVGGTLFETYKENLLKYPSTMLGCLYGTDQKIPHDEIPFFDRSPEAFSAILSFYRLGTLIRPRNIPIKIWFLEIDFWMVKEFDSPIKYNFFEDKVNEKLYLIGSRLEELSRLIKRANSFQETRSISERSSCIIS